MIKDWKSELTLEEKHLAFNKVIELCHANLFAGATDILSYLYARGISDETINTFKIGAMPKNISILTKYVGKRPLFKCGIIGFDGYQSISRYSDHRLIIPVFNECSNPIAIIGRTILSEKERESKTLIKYINTFYKKGKSLFGLNYAKEAIRKSGKAYVVEGNFDVIMAYQNGMRNVVASSGTFLTKHQVLLLSRYTDTVSVLFDNDEAGQLASKKINDSYKEFDAVKIQVSKLPSRVKDLDEYFRKRACKKR